MNKPLKEKDFLEEAEKEKKELAESYKESRRQQKERKLKEKTFNSIHKSTFPPIL